MNPSEISMQKFCPMQNFIFSLSLSLTLLELAPFKNGIVILAC